MNILLYAVPAAAAVALLFAFIKARGIARRDEGEPGMAEIAHAISEGADAFLKSEYKLLLIFIAIVFAGIWLGLGSITTAVAFLVGALFSVLAGYFGMKVATRANVRTANAARTGGINEALRVAFSGGTVMGMCVVGLGLIGASILYIITENGDVLTGFSLGASSVALFARVGGGIYTKAADVGADLVGKVEAGIPEDDPRNPAVIADNVGDNVGDVAGMGADLFESYVGSIVSAIVLGVFSFGATGAVYPLALSGLGIIASVLGTFFVRGGKNADPMKALKMGSYTSAILVAAGSVALSYFCFGGINTSFAIICGLIVGLAIGFFTEVYTSDKYRFVKNIAEQSTTGSATNIICGLSTGMLSTCVSIILVCLGILGAYKFAGLYGIALAAVGMLSTAGMTVAVDAYGPIADNAGGIAEMAGLEDSVRDITDRLDSVGNTTAAMGKGFAIGSAALTAMALFVSYAQAAELQMIDILDPFVIIGLLLGGMLPFLFSALTMSSVSKAAESMIREVRRQFKEHTGILKGTERPDYRTCVSIAATSALKEMILPGAIAIVAPLLVGFLLGPAALGGLLAGSVVTGVLMAIFMSNSGGAWDNAKKYIEGGNFGGKGSEAHKAAVVGDTVGDPFKDTSGPSINILIKLMTIVSLVFVPLMK
ncbi:putative K(+)-stimulated pyrophosphate-energized sodium pump [Clostridium sp. CAG:226]|jgi:K(+)-stimulated pyrophosphate-energized sodium pump|nr:putative K(+)-stimulated pyrophosphate-energized sodium pump [Clostridium sp. CAG:226]